MTVLSEVGTGGASGQQPITPQRVRQFLTQIGPTGVMLGQYFALRADLFSVDIRRELLALTDRSPALPLDSFEPLIAEELGVPVDAAFPWIGPQPLTANLVSQSHAAHTRDGREVIVRVQTPGALDSVRRDMSRVHVLRRLLVMMQADSLLPVTQLQEEFNGWLGAQLDYAQELRNLAYMVETSGDADRWRVPRVYRALSGPRVLTVEFLSGVPLNEVLLLHRGAKQRRLATLRIDPAEVAENLLATLLDQVLRMEFYLTDLHPDNLLVLPGNAIAYAGWAHTDSLDPQFRPGFTRCLSAIAEQDIDRLFDGLIDLVIPTERSDRSRLRGDFQDMSTRGPGERTENDAGESPTVRYLTAFVQAARRNGFRLPDSVLALYRTLLTAQLVASQLGGQKDLALVAKPVIDRLQWQSMWAALRPESLQPALLDGIGLMRDGPRTLRRLLTDLADGRLVVRVRTVEAEEDRRQTNLRARLVTAATVSVAAAILVIATRETDFFGLFPASWLFWGVLALVWGWIVSMWRRL